MEDGLSVTWRAAARLEAAIALCAALNAAYFLRRAMSGRTLARRAAAFLLAVLSLGTLAESVVVFVSLQAGADGGEFASTAWISARTVTFSATACISVLIMRGR
ncbi:MAG TPA: hypothetical protein VGR43_09115 [Dehalococcoidia bacterium]|nr:hypothetical protein [Dehalococcoidia bacterium]